MVGSPDVTSWWESKLTSSACAYSRSESLSCKTVVEPGAEDKPIRRCERIKKLLRHCPGKPTEVVESTSEVTEEEETSVSRLTPDFGAFAPLPSLPSLPPFLPRAPEGPSGEERVGSFFEDMFKVADDLLGQFGSRLEESADEALKGLFPSQSEDGEKAGGSDVDRLEKWSRFLGLDKNGKSEGVADTDRSKTEPRREADQYKGWEQKFEEV